MTQTTTTRPPPRHDVTTALHSDGRHYATCVCGWHSLPVQTDHAAMVAAGRHLQGRQTTEVSNLWKISSGVGLLAVIGFVAGMAAQGEDVMSPIIVILIMVAGATAYLLPTLIASSRKHHNLGSVAVINIFLGWTFVGWVVALAMAASAVRPAQRL